LHLKSTKGIINLNFGGFMETRERKVNIDALSPERIEEMAHQIGEKIGKKIEAVALDIKSLLAVYGLDIKLTYLIHPIGENPLDELIKEQEKAKEN
jgi:hypothetical protein